MTCCNYLIFVRLHCKSAPSSTTTTTSNLWVLQFLPGCSPTPRPAGDAPRPRVCWDSVKESLQITAACANAPLAPKPGVNYNRSTSKSVWSLDGILMPKSPPSGFPFLFTPHAVNLSGVHSKENFRYIYSRNQETLTEAQQHKH